MKKPIMLINDDEKLKELADIVEAKNADLENQIKFLKKQAKDLHTKNYKAISEIITQMENRLRELGKLPKDFDAEKHDMFFQDGERVIYYQPNDEPEPPNNFFTIIRE